MVCVCEVGRSVMCVSECVCVCVCSTALCDVCV